MNIFFVSLKKTRAFLFFLPIFFSTFQATGQACSYCPLPANCSACSGGLTSLTLKFNQSVASVITASDQQGVVFSGTVNQGGTFTFTGSIANDKFAGPFVTLTVNGIEDTQIKSSCGGLEVYVGNTYGSFNVIAGKSKNGGAICCSPLIPIDTPPVISNCPSDIIVSSTDPLACLLAVSWDPLIASDNCEVSSFTSNYKPGDSFPLGTTQVKYRAIDNNSNVTSCVFNVVVIDNASPVFTGCSDVTVSVVGVACSSVVNWVAPVATDCDAVTISSNRSPGSTFSVGTTVVTYSAMDGSGNLSICSFNVIVNDNIKPTLTACPIDITVFANTSCKAIVTWAVPIATDNCTLISLTPNISRGSTFSLGTTVVTYTATDGSGNIATCSFNVIVKDNTKPVFTQCPSDIIAPASSTCDAIVNWALPVAIDNCSVSLTSDHSPGETFALGATLVTYTATDGSGNASTCSFKILVKDETSPVISGCPIDIEAPANASCSAIVNWAIPTATDNCSVTMISSHNPGTSFPLGNTVVTYKATDGSGNVSICTFNVLVKDNTSPVIAGCPSDIIVSADASCKAVVAWTPPNATDNCNNVSMSSNHNPSEIFSLGTTLISYVAQDQAGNTSTCSFNVIVKDTTPPIFTGCPINISVLSDASCKAVVNWIEPTANDNCSGSVTPTSNFKPGGVFESGTTTRIIYEAIDAAGNKATCQFNVTVRNESVAIISNCPKDIEIKTDETGKAIVTWDEPSAKDLCGDVLLTSSHKSGSEFSIGTTKVTYQSPPNSLGVITKCEFNVTLSYKEIAFEVGKVLTPNSSDDINSYWLISGIEDFSSNEVLIVDRWGTQVYQASRYDNNKVRWDGTNSAGAIVPTGTYFYSVIVSFRGNRVEKKGSVEVVK